MSTVLCSISGIEFTTQYMPLYLTARESHHPIFDVPPEKLLKLTERWVEQELKPVESYLLYVALFNSTSRIQFRSPATYLGAPTDAVVAANMEKLVSITSRILSAGSDKVNDILHLPLFVISPDTKDLLNSGDWISIWENCYKDYEDHYRTSSQLDKIARKEVNLERYIRDRTKEISSYSSQLAEWASLAGKFPNDDAGPDMPKIVGKSMTLSSYWRHIIKSCAAGESIWNIPAEDIKELIEHCEECIPQGSIFSHTLMSLLRSGLSSVSNFFNLGDIDISRNGSLGFKILDSGTSVEDANKLAIIESAPLTQPIESQYPNKLAYIKAKQAYNMKRTHESQLREQELVNAASQVTPASVTLISKL